MKKIILLLFVLVFLSVSADGEMYKARIDKLDGITHMPGNFAVTGNLTVTNTGTGNTAVFNDEAGDTSPFVIDLDGNVYIGGGSTGVFEVLAPGAGRTVGPITVNSNGAINFGQLSSTPGENSVITMRSRIGGSFFRNDGSNTIYIGQADLFTVSSAGFVGINTSSAPDEKLEVNGNIHLRDNNKSLHGTGKNGEVFYDNANLIINPNAVGVGKVYIGVTGDDIINAGGYETAGVAGITDNTSFWLCTAVDCSTTCQATIAGGIITGCP